MLINNTNKYFKFKRGEVVGKGECVKEQSVTALNLSKEKLEKDNSILDNLHVTHEHSDVVTKLVKDNLDLFSEKDVDLGHTNTVKMVIDTGNHPPIKKR